MPGFEIFGDEERKEVMDVLDTGVLMRYNFDGPRKGIWKAKEFEDNLCARLGVKHAHLCSSGTSALCVALAACGVGAGDEVIVPPFTFVATIEAVLFAGAIPVFADIDETLCLDPKAVEKAITQKTKAVIPVHMCGSMAKIDELKSLCDDKGILLIEDACQAVGGTFKGRSLGSIGQMGCFSFDYVKTITCGEGGAAITNDENLYFRAHAFSDHGHDHIGSDRGKEDHILVGTNYRISELNAAVGVAQLRKLDTILDTQRKNKKTLKDALSTIPEITFRDIPDPEGDTATFLAFFLPSEERAREIAQAFAAAGIDGCFYWYDNNWHYIRKWDHIRTLTAGGRLPQADMDNSRDYRNISLPVSDAIISKTICLQVKLGWSKEELDSRVSKILKVFGK